MSKKIIIGWGISLFLLLTTIIFGKMTSVPFQYSYGEKLLTTCPTAFSHPFSLQKKWQPVDWGKPLPDNYQIAYCSNSPYYFILLDTFLCLLAALFTITGWLVIKHIYTFEIKNKSTGWRILFVAGTTFFAVCFLIPMYIALLFILTTL